MSKTPKNTLPNPSSVVANPKICQHYSNGNNAGDCKGHRAGLLTGNEIIKYNIIENRNDSECLQTTSYDLRLGEGHMVYDSTAKKWSAIWVSTKPHPKDGNPVFDLPQGTNLVIPRFGMALIQLREPVNLLSCIENSEQPVMICGHFDLKLSRVKEGLISQQATQVEPGYRGKLFCYLFNQTGDEISLSYTDIDKARIATIEFQYVSCISQCDSSIRKKFLASLSKKHRKYIPPYCDLHGINDVRFFDGARENDGKLPKHGGLSSIAQSLDDAQENARKGCEQAIKEAVKSKLWFMGLVTIIVTMSLFILLLQGTFGEIDNVWNLLVSNRGKVAAIITEVHTERNSLKTLRDEAQKTYKKAKTELDELDKQKKALLLQEKSSITKKPVISNKKTGEGDNQ